MPFPAIVLASASPRRRELLTQAGVAFTCEPAHADESALPGEPPEQTAARLAELKAAAIAARRPAELVLGADTIVVCEGQALGKPADLTEARSMLRLLSGKPHVVLTGVALLRQQPRYRDVWVASTRVVFKTLTPATIEEYLRRVHVLDKAGAYAVQEHGDLIVDHLEGSLSNVIGLPVEEVAARLATFPAACAV